MEIVIDVELSDLVIAVTHHLHLGPVSHADTDLSLVYLHVVHVDSQVAGGGRDGNINQHVSFDGEVVGDDVGDEIQLVPSIELISYFSVTTITYLEGLILVGSLTLISFRSSLTSMTASWN